LSVDHPVVVQNYRTARALELRRSGEKPVRKKCVRQWSTIASFLTNSWKSIRVVRIGGPHEDPFKPDRSGQDRDNPVVPNVVEQPVERAADRAATHDNPLVPNVIERPIERAVADDRGAVIDRPGIVDRPGINDGPGDRPGIKDSRADIARGRAAAGAPVVARPLWMTARATGLESQTLRAV
jgi:hypothetical protein